MISALILAVVVGLNPRLDLLKEPGKYLFGWLWRTAVAFVPLWVITYFSIEDFAGPFWGATPYLLVGWGINTVVSFFAATEFGNRHDWSFPHGIWLFLAVAVIMAFRGIGGTSLFTSSDRYAVVGQVATVDSTADLAPIDLAHIRQVSLEQASWLANKVLGEAPGAIGSRFHVGWPTLQRVDDEFMYVAPLEFNSFRHWQSNDGTPGYVTVSATDPAAPARLVMKNGETPLVFKYMPTSFFGTNLERYVLEHGYRGNEVNDYHFELDDEHRPWWVVTLTQPTHGYSVQRITKVLLVDPQNGKIEEHTLSDLPAWVDRAVPENLAVSYLTWWGHYLHGWWNSVWNKDAMTEPTVERGMGVNSQEQMSLVYGADGQAYWFTGMNSTASSDQALTSAVLMNSRTGEVRQYRMTGANESAVVSAVNSAVSNYRGYHATAPIPYHIYGTTAWVVPVLSEEHIFQRLAIVRASDLHVSLGGNSRDVLRDFKRELTVQGGQINPTGAATEQKVTLRVDRFYGDVQNGTTVYHIWSASRPSNVFTATSAVSPMLPLVVPGDEIEIGFIDTTDTVVPISSLVPKQRN